MVGEELGPLEGEALGSRVGDWLGSIVVGLLDGKDVGDCWESCWAAVSVTHLVLSWWATYLALLKETHWV